MTIQLSLSELPSWNKFNIFGTANKDNNLLQILVTIDLPSIIKGLFYLNKSTKIIDGIIESD